MADLDERDEELTTLAAIFPELSLDPASRFSVTLALAVAPAQPLLVRFVPLETQQASSKGTYAQKASTSAAYVEHDVRLSHLPPLTLHVVLPDTYPADAPPQVWLSASCEWLPQEKLSELEHEAEKLWEDYGHCQILFAYIDYLQQAAERGFDLDQSTDGCLVLPMSAEPDLVTFDSDEKQSIFNAGTYDCSICLEPKKGTSCYQLRKCSHVFCRQCLQDFYNNAITEGDVASVRCLSPDCGKVQTGVNGRKARQRTERTLRPQELLAAGLEESMVRRYVEMKRKKKLEADKDTVYCPRSWCQGPARSPKYPPIPADLFTYAATERSSDDESDGETAPASPSVPLSPSSKDDKTSLIPTDRIAICEKCQLAFCRTCYRGWHGDFARCFPRDPNELSAEEKASYDYILLNTSPCPTCNSPTQKTMGCNHMKCFQCSTHFCYLCSAWLISDNPYKHFNKPGTQCYQRLWELEEGDEGRGPADGRGYGGGRHWERIALEAAREAEQQEAAAAAATQAEEDAREARILQAADELLVAAMARIQADDEAEVHPAQRPPDRGGRHRGNAFRARPPAQGAANVVRDHEQNRGRGNGRGRGRGGVVRRPALNDEERQQAELQRFLDMAQRDEEDGWDSDELGDGDEEFVIR